MREDCLNALSLLFINKDVALDYDAIGSLQVAIHVVQNRRAGEQKSHWDKTNKRHT